MTDSPAPLNGDNLQENFEDFFEMALCGYVITDAKGFITRANKKMAEWMDCEAVDLKGKKFSGLLAIGGKIYFETHLSPLLRMQGFFDEVVLEVNTGENGKLRVLLNAYERRDEAGQVLFVRYTILKASDRLRYEQNLQEAKKTAEKELVTQTESVVLREQLIAVLGHDLRNPLSAIKMALSLIDLSGGHDNTDLLAILNRSSSRMTELVNNIMDFARTRLGEGIILSRKNVLLEPVLSQVTAELKLIYPKKEIITSFGIAGAVNCDPDRIAQLVSNLLANALTHGTENTPVHLRAFHKNGHLVISVLNEGVPIAADLHELLFAPFTRDTNRPSQNGLGLGLYICSEIAKAHHAALIFTSDEKETCFTFDMDVESL